MSDGEESFRCVCAVLRGASRHLSRHYDAALAPYGLSLNQYSILARLQRLGEADLGTLAETLVMDRSTLGHLIRPLQARGWLRSAPAKADRRKTMLSLSPEGEALVAKVRPEIARLRGEVEAALGVRETELLTGLLDRVSMLRL